MAIIKLEFLRIFEPSIIQAIIRLDIRVSSLNPLFAATIARELRLEKEFTRAVNQSPLEIANLTARAKINFK